jgi:hypothetical protein
LESAAIESDFTLRKINMNSSGTYTYASEGDDDFIQFSLFADDTQSYKLNYAMGGSTSGCIMSLDNSQDINTSMRYENDLLKAKFADANDVLFDPSGFIQATGNKSAYDLSIVSNDGFAPTSWYDMEVSGEGAEVIFRKAENGYILRGDELKNVTVKAFSDSAEPSCRFSTDYNEVFIYEIDENTIGISVDTDDNGTYETEIESIAAESFGDPNYDGKIDAKDASLILVAYAKASTGADDELTDTQRSSADVNGDNKVDAKDASSILAYYALASTASGDIPTLKEFVTPKYA